MTALYEFPAVFLGVMLSCLAVMTLVWMLEAWRSEEAYEKEMHSSAPALSRIPKFSLILPARHEVDVLRQTIAGIVSTTYPNFEVIVVIGDDDLKTKDVAESAEAEWPDYVRVVTDFSSPKCKPSALNTGLRYCSGSIVGVFDAEDEVSKDLLELVAERFESPGISIVQGGVQLVNTRSTWFSLRNCLEYYLWYRSRLHWHARCDDFIPLGGNTVFIRRDLLDEVGGWDEYSLTEDCELGIRLGVIGAGVAVLYSPRTSTLEETPLSLASFVKQRTRWGQGFIQTLKKGSWRDLPRRRQRFAVLYTLLTPYIQALVLFNIPMALLGFLFFSIGENFAMFLFLPLLLLVVTLVFECLALQEFGKDFDIRIGARDYLILALSTIPYQFLLSLAGCRAVWRNIQGETGWEKTRHVGAHRAVNGQS